MRKDQEVRCSAVSLEEVERRRNQTNSSEERVWRRNWVPWALPLTSLGFGFVAVALVLVSVPLLPPLLPPLRRSLASCWKSWGSLCRFGSRSCSRSDFRSRLRGSRPFSTEGRPEYHDGVSEPIPTVYFLAFDFAFSRSPFRRFSSCKSSTIAFALSRTAAS